MVGRSGSANSEGSERGFNGEIKDDDIKGEGNSYDYGNRFYDPRLGKFLSLDGYASKYPSVSPYSFALNSPIRSKDVGGDSVLFYSESGEYLGYSHDNVRYKDKNLLVVVNDKDVKTFKKEYDRKRSDAYQKKNKLSDNQVEQHVAGLEAMGTSYDVNDFYNFYDNHKNLVKTEEGSEVEWSAKMYKDKSNPLDKDGSLVVDDKTAFTDGAIDDVVLGSRYPGIDGDFHTHIDDAHVSGEPSKADRNRVSYMEGRKSVIVSVNTFTVYQGTRDGSFKSESKQVKIEKDDFKNAK